MGDIQGNNQKIYNFLASKHVKNIGANAEEFQQKMGDDGNRRKVYDYLRSMRVKNIGADYDEFAALVYDGRQQNMGPVQTDAPMQTGTPQSRERTGMAPTALQAPQGGQPQKVAAASASTQQTFAPDQKWAVPQASEFVSQLQEMRPAEPKEPEVNPFPYRGEDEKDIEAIRKRITDLQGILADVRGDTDFADEYDKRKREVDESTRGAGFVRGDVRGKDIGGDIVEGRKWLEDNKTRYGNAVEDRKAAKDIEDEIDQLKGQIQDYLTVNAKRDLEKAQDANREQMPGGAAYEYGVSLSPVGALASSVIDNENFLRAKAGEIYRMAGQELNQGSKYDPGYNGGDLEKALTAINQYAEGAANQLDTGSLTQGLSEGSSLIIARRIGDKYNKVITEALKGMKMSNGDMNALISFIDTNGRKLQGLVEELDKEGADLKTMNDTYEDMVRRGDPDARKYGMELQKRLDSYNKRVKEEYDPLRAQFDSDMAAYQKINEAIDAAVKNGMSDGDMAVLDALEKLINAKTLRAADVSTASKSGAGFEQSVEFIVDFILTGGISEAGSKAATKIATNRMLKKVGAEAIKDMAIKPGLGLRFATDMVTSGIRTAVMAPRNLQAYGEQLTEYVGKDSTGRYNFDRTHLNAFLNTALTQYIEYWSEGFGTYFSEGERALFRAVTGKAPTTALGATLGGYRGSIGRYLEHSKFDGMFNEMLEEVVGAGLNGLAGWLSDDRVGDEQAWKQFWAGDNLATLTLSFLPMSIISAGSNVSSYLNMRDRYKAGEQMLNDFVKSGKIDQADVDYLREHASEMTPEQIKKRIMDISDKALPKNGGHLPGDFAKNMIGFVEGCFAADMRNEAWDESREKMAVVGAFTNAYNVGDAALAWDAAQEEQAAKTKAMNLGFTEEELDSDAMLLAREAAAIRETEQDRSQALSEYAVAKAQAEGLKRGYLGKGEKLDEQFENDVRQNLNRDGIVVTANLNVNGDQVPVFVLSDDATIGEGGSFTTPSGPDGMVQYRTSPNSDIQTAKASELSGGEVQLTDQYIDQQLEDNRWMRNARYEVQKNSISPRGMSRMLAQRKGTNVVVKGYGAYMPVRVERMTDEGRKVAIKGDKDAIKAIASFARLQGAGTNRLEIEVEKLFPLLEREADGSLSTYEDEETKNTTEQEQRQTPQIDPNELPGTERTILIEGTPTKVTVDNVGGDGVWFHYTDSEGNERDSDMPVESFMDSLVEEQAPAAEMQEAPEQAPVEGTPAPAPAQARTSTVPVDEKNGKREFDHPSVTPEQAYGELMNGVEPGSKNEANRRKFIESSANKAAAALTEAQNKIAGLQARRDAVDEWEINEDEDIDAFEARQNAERAKLDAQIAEIEAQVPELQRKASHWAAVRDMAGAVSSERKDAKLVEAADAWTQRTGVKVRAFRTPDEVDDKTVRDALAQGKRVGGWYNPNTGEVGLYLPNLADEAEVAKTFIHEVISHKGLRDMLGKENYDALCDKVWDQLMSEENRQKYLDYNSHLKGSEESLRRAAADEWIAHFSETLGLEENRNLFDKFVEFVKEFLDRILGEDSKISKDDLANLLRSSLARYESERKADKKAELFRDGISSETQAAQLDDNAIRFNIKTEESVEKKIRDFAKSKEGRKLGWTDAQIDSIISETADLMRVIHDAVSGDKYYDEWAEKVPTIKVDWRDGVEKPTVTWSRANIEYKYDMSADLLCINNEGLETVLASPTMVELMLKINETAKDYKEGFTSDDYLRLYETLRDMGFVVPCKGCFDAAVRLKSLPTVSKKFVELVNKIIDERNADPVAFDRKVRAKAGDNATISGLPGSANNMEDAIRTGVVGDNLTEHISWAQLMSAEGQTKALSDWGGIFRAWERTGAGRPKDKLLPEPWSGDIVNTTTTIIGKFGEKTPSYRAISVNQGTGLRRNSHSEFRPLLAIDEIQFMREAFIRGLTVFKYMKELDDVRLFGKLGVKFNMSFFPAFVEGAPAAGLDANGNYIAAEESVGGREFEYVGEDGKTHYDGMKGWQEAMKYINKDVSLSSVIFSIPHLIKAFTDVPTKSDPRGIWGSLIPFHATGATFASLKRQGLGEARALGHSFEEALTDYGKGVTNFEAVQNDMFGEGWEVVEGKKAGTKVEPGHKLEFSDGTHYYNAGLGLHLFRSKYIFDSEMDEHPGEFASVKEYAEKYGHPYSIDYNDKVRELGTGTAYQDASDYYIDMLRSLGLVPRFDFEVPEDIFLMMCSVVNVDPNHPKLGWKGEGNSWSPVDSEAYYSLWCDYGMIDPDTGMLAPHNPVGIVDANGNRTFQLPENTVDIIKDGVARYSERKDREAARELDAIEEFARRTVAEGKLKQEDADAIISQARAEQENPDVAADGSWTHFRKLEDPAKIEELENGEWEDEAYRAVQFVPDPNGEWEYDLGDGKGMQKGNVYPPMSAQTEKGEWRNPIQKGVIEESEEAPGKAFLKKGKWVFRLHKGNGKYVDAAYNPYIHSSDTMLNDQFSEAQSRGNLVVMRVAVPKSELDGDNPYHAEKAKDHVGRHDWKAGPIQGELTGTRTVYLSRYDKPMELMPIEKVGESVAKMLEGQVETMPTNVVWPQLRAELEKRGMEFVETDNKGKLVSGENAGKTWKQVYGKKKPAKKKPKKSDAGSTRFRIANQTQNGFVSNAEASLDRIKMEKATPEQWVKMLEKEGGLKAGEDKWLGLSDWLKSQDKKTITKQEIADYIAENRIQIEEVNYSESAEKTYADAIDSYRAEYSQFVDEGKEAGEDNPYVYAYAQMGERYGEDFDIAFERDGDTISPSYDYYGEDLSDAAKYFLDQRRESDVRAINSTRLEYTTSGLSNKREIVLTVPTIEPWNQNDHIHFGDAGEGRAVAWIRFGETTTSDEAVDAAKEYHDFYSSMQDKYGMGWENKMTAAEKKKAEEVNAKVNDSTDEKRVLVIDEIQSKRHQEGREKGYVSDELKKLEKEYDEFVDETAKKHNVDVAILDEVATPEEIDRAVEYDRRIQELRKQSGTVPAAPFEKNWHELAMKRMLRLAAEEGYDYVAWTTGDQQAERYNIGGVVDRIVSGVDSRGKRHLVLYPKDRAFIAIEHDGNGNIVNVQGDNGAFSGAKNISDIVGKELAEQALQVTEPGSSKEFSGDGLKYGGEGMKGFYDEILPRFMNKYGKKWGVKVSDITLPNVEEAGRVMHAVPVTQEMKESVMEGQTMFRKVTPEQDKEYMDAVNAGDMEKAGQMVRDAFKAAFPNTKAVDENGEPMVVYHGTLDEFSVFERDKTEFGAFHFSTSEEGARDAVRNRIFEREALDFDESDDVRVANEIASNEARIIPAYLNITNLYHVSDDTANDIALGREEGDFSPGSGYVYRNDIEGGGADSYMVLNSNQIKSADPVTYDDSGNIIPLSERFNPENNDIRFRRVTPEENREYMEAVKSFDNDKAAQILRDAFKEVYPDTKIVDENGEPLKVYHGSRSSVYFTEFDYNAPTEKAYASGEKPAYFFTSEKGARRYARHNLMDGPVIPAYLAVDNPYEIDYEGAKFNGIGIIAKVWDRKQREWVTLPNNADGKSLKYFATPQEAVREYARTHPGVSYVRVDRDIIINRVYDAKPNIKDLMDSIDRDQYDGAIIKNIYEINSTIDDYVAFRPEQIKSADTVTRDDDGNVIPLDQRFNQEVKDIRFRRAMTEDEVREERIAEAEVELTDKTLDSMPQSLGSGVLRVFSDEMPKGHESDKGYFDPETNTVSVCMDNVLDGRDAVATAIHETVGHKGLDGIFGEQYKDAMVGAYASLDAEGRAWVNGYIVRNNLPMGDDAILRGMMEYMAGVAERNEGDALDAVNDVLSQAVDMTYGTEGFRFTNRELAYILRSSFEHMRNADWLNTREGKAKDILMKRELGINESDENRQVDPEAQDAGIRFRRGYVGNAVADSERENKRWKNVAIMEIQNADLPVKIAYEAMLKEKFGDRWEEKFKSLPENEDYLMRHNLSSSRADTENFEFMTFRMNPMLAKVEEVQQKLAGKKANTQKLRDAYDRVLNYLYAVSGLERNEWKRNNGGEARDYSGITALMGYTDEQAKEKWQQAEEEAKAMVAEFERDVNDKKLLDELWDSIRACTDFSLDHAYNYGLLTKEEYERLRGTDTQPRMWNYYLPLRGFSEETAEEAFDYVRYTTLDSFNNGVVKEANGRWSLADSPLANIQNIAQREIVQGNENWSRQALLRFVRNTGKNSLLSERDVWYVRDADTGEWTKAVPEGEDIDKFEKDMEEKRKNGNAKKDKTGLDIDRIMANKSHENQHLIRVKTGGVEHAIWVNGDPAMAKAVTGIGKQASYQNWRAANRVFSNMFTTYSLDFTAKNLIRDTLYSRMAMLAKEDREYRWKFEKNWWSNGGVTGIRMMRLAALWDSGELVRKEQEGRLSRKEQLFVDFMRDGGQTGYTVIRSVEKLKKDIEEQLVPSLLSKTKKKVVDGTTVHMAGVDVPILGLYTWGVRTLNEAFELLTRFTAYETSREVGRSGQRAAYDAKEISVNFNRRGAQSNQGAWGSIAAYFGGTHYFFNAGVQGFDNFLRLFKTSPKTMTAESVAVMSLGFLTPWINSLLGGGDGDDDENKKRMDENWYWNMPEWVRRNNIVIRLKKDFYIAVPLPVEFRALYGLGDIARSIYDNKYPNPSPGDVTMDILSTASSILPVNPIEGYNGKSVDLVEATFRSVVPDIGIFAVDWVTNKDYTGRELVKKNIFAPEVPTSQGAYASTPKALVDACQWMGEHYGVDIAPGLLRDGLSNYLGGYYKFAEDLAKQLYSDDERPSRWDDIPFLSGFTGHLDEDRKITYVNNVLYEYKDVMENVVKKMNLYNRSKDIKAKQAFTEEETLPDKAKIQKLLLGKDYNIAKMYYNGMADELTGEKERVVKVHKTGKRAGQKYTTTREIKIPGVNTLRKTWQDYREVWAKLPDKTEEEKAAKADAYKDMVNAWHEYYNAAADLADQLMKYEYEGTITE